MIWPSCHNSRYLISLYICNYSVEGRQRDQYCSDDYLHMQIYRDTQRHKLKRQLPESLLFQEDPEKGVREGWYKKDRVNFTDKVHIMKESCIEPGQNKMNRR